MIDKKQRKTCNLRFDYHRSIIKNEFQTHGANYLTQHFMENSDTEMRLYKYRVPVMSALLNTYLNMLDLVQN